MICSASLRTFTASSKRLYEPKFICFPLNFSLARQSPVRLSKQTPLQPLVLLEIGLVLVILLICVPLTNPAFSRCLARAYFPAQSLHILISGLVSVSVALRVILPQSQRHSHKGTVLAPREPRLSERPMTMSFPKRQPTKLCFVGDARGAFFFCFVLP